MVLDVDTHHNYHLKSKLKEENFTQTFFRPLLVFNDDYGLQ